MFFWKSLDFSMIQRKESDTTEPLHFHWKNYCFGFTELCRQSDVSTLGFPCGWDGKESKCNVGDLDSNPGLQRSLGKEKGYPLQYSGLENSDMTKQLSEPQDVLIRKYLHISLYTKFFSSHGFFFRDNLKFIYNANLEIEEKVFKPTEWLRKYRKS